MILVTGASGLLGSNLTLAAVASGAEVRAVYRQHPVAFPGADCLAVDLEDANAVEGLVARSADGTIIHCAAATNVDWCEANADACWKTNVSATIHVAAAARRAGAPLIYISTDSLFDGQGGPYDEAATPRPLNQYARSKLAGEAAVLAASPRNLVVRTNIYGWNAIGKHSLAEWVLARLESGESVPGFRDVTFTPMLVNDLADAILALAERGCAGVYHVAGSEACSKLDFARQIATVFGQPPERVRDSSVADSPLRAARPRNTALRTDRVAAALGRRMPTVHEGLVRFRALRDSGHAARLRQADRS